MSISVVIPVKNGGNLLNRVIEHVLEQQNPSVKGLICLDSGSTDGSREYLSTKSMQDNRVTVIDIPPADFNHGGTRNIGISATDTEWVALLTQDALPAGIHWLRALHAAATQADDIAGVTGRQIPYPSAPLCTKRELAFHFERMARQPAVMREADLDSPTPERHQASHFFSNNNAFIRRSVWQQHPFPEVPFGEDQLWAERILRGGYAKAYAHDAVVEHSHDFNWRELYARSRIEGEYYASRFGYRMVPHARSLPLLWYREFNADALFRRRYPDQRGSLLDVARSTSLQAVRLWGWYQGERKSGGTPPPTEREAANDKTHPAD